MIVTNGRTLSAPLTGIQRYAAEIIKRSPQMQVVAPACAAQGALGHVWEQCVLPLRVGKNLLWSPSNTGPLAIKRQVVTVHDLATFEYPEGFSTAFRGYYNYLLPKLLPNVASILTVSEFTRERIIERFGIAPERIHVIALAVDHAQFYPRSEQEIQTLTQRLALPKRYMLFLGALSARKNVARLLQAWHIAQDSVAQDVELLIAGGAESLHVFDGVRLPALPKRTRLLGRIEGEALPTLLSGAELFCFPSLYEGFGLPPLEAMACGTACLVSNSTAIPEVVADAAMRVNATDVAAMADGLTQLLNDASLRQNYVAKGIERAKQFQWDKTATDTNHILRAC